MCLCTSTLLVADQKNQTRLYDFKHQPLDVQQYSTFADYMKQHGLNRNSTVIYLCTSEVAHAISKPVKVQHNPDILPPLAPLKTEPIPALAEDYRSPSSSGNILEYVLIIVSLFFFLSL